MSRNLIIKHDPCAYVHPSSIRSETRRDIVEREREHRVRKRNIRVGGIWILRCHYPRCIYISTSRRADASFRNTSHYMTYGAHGGVARPQIERRAKERNRSAGVCVRVYSSGNGKRSYIASVSCCARINREMMRPPPGEMSSEPVMASWLVHRRVLFSRLFRSSSRWNYRCTFYSFQIHAAFIVDNKFTSSILKLLYIYFYLCIKV